MRVLIVEDDVLIAMHLEYLLTGFNHSVCAIARDADTAVAHGARHMPDVVLMDLRLARGTHGSDAARKLYELYKIRCIFVSANLDETTRNELQPFEPIDFVNKPVNPDHLHRALEKVPKAA